MIEEQLHINESQIRLNKKIVLGSEVALSMIGNLCELVSELAIETNRLDLVERVRETLSMASDVLGQEPGE